MRLTRLFFGIALFCCTSLANAHDFEISLKNGQRLYFNITDSAKRTVEVTYQGSITNPSRAKFSGDLVLTSKVRYKNKVYSITSIGAKAFSNNKELKSIEMPVGIKQIDDFAFEGCSSLTRVAFPSNTVKIGTGVFFGCTSLNSVVLGSEWTAVNLKDFEWSKSLKKIKIPARVKSLKNLKSLSYLEKIEIDSDNQFFKSVDGSLYSKNGETLLGCPKGHQGKLVIADGTKTVNRGAIADCRNLTRVVIPMTVKNLSFREFSLLTKLKEIVMKADTPIMTAKKDGKEEFLLVVANTDANLVVNRKSKKEYANKIVTDSGEYTDIVTAQNNNQEGVLAMPYHVDSAMTINKNHIIGVKNFDDFK